MPPGPDHRAARRWSIEDRWHRYLRTPSDQRPITPVLVLTVLSLLLTPFLGDEWWGRVVLVGLVGVGALMALIRTGAHSRIRTAAMVAVVAAVLAAAGTTTAGNVGRGTWQQILATALFAGLLIVTPTVVLLRLLLRPRINIDTLVGALTAYLQVGIFFASVYRLVDLSQSEPFFGSDAAVSAQTFQYFSFITLTTTGYGDFTPATSLGQTLAISEAIFGQVFLVTVVALTVSNLGKELPHRRGVSERSSEQSASGMPDDSTDEHDPTGER